jgi:hypothetical protein
MPRAGATHASNLKCYCRLHSRLREVHSRVGKIDSYPDTELRLVAALRRAARERGGPLPLIAWRMRCWMNAES